MTYYYIEFIIMWGFHWRRSPDEYVWKFYLGIDNDSKYSIIPATCVSTIACLPARLSRYSRSDLLSIKKFSLSTATQCDFLRI